jgi:hypothetical protein
MNNTYKTLFLLLLVAVTAGRTLATNNHDNDNVEVPEHCTDGHGQDGVNNPHCQTEDDNDDDDGDDDGGGSGDNGGGHGNETGDNGNGNGNGNQTNGGGNGNQTSGGGNNTGGSGNQTSNSTGNGNHAHKHIGSSGGGHNGLYQWVVTQLYQNPSDTQGFCYEAYMRTITYGPNWRTQHDFKERTSKGCVANNVFEYLLVMK